MVVAQNKTNLRSKLRWGIVGIVALMAVSSVFDFPAYFNKGMDWVNAKTGLGIPKVPERAFNLGLDLQGGAHLLYKADVTNIPAGDRTTAVEGVRDVIERRVNGLGVSEPIVQTTKVGDEYRVQVELPGIKDVNRAIQMIGGTPILEFKEQNTEPARSLTDAEKKDLQDYNKNALAKATEALKKIKAGTDFAQVVNEYSDDTTSKNNGGYLGYIGKDYPDSALYDWASKNVENSLSTAPIQSMVGYNDLKRGKERDGAVEVQASHILICYLGAKNCDATLTKEEALAKAQDLFKQANAENFAQLAKDNSTDPGTKDKGGDLGFFTQNSMVSAFADAAFKAKVGEIVGPVETEFGYHIIYKKAEQKTKEYELYRVLVRTKAESDILPPQDEWKNTGLSGKQLKRSEVVTDQRTGAVEVSIQFNDEGKQLFADLTEKNVGKPIAIFLDGQAISIPKVNTPIRDGQAVITGSFTLEEAKLLSQRLNAGALPVPVELVSQQTVGASLGMDSLNKSLDAGLVGLLLVAAFMIIYYRLPGLLAVLALILYTALTLAVTKLIGTTLTLSGIAGFIMSIGVAVDANVLIFERLKEELRAGKSLKAAAEEGFLRAWTSIRDSNLSTLISCVILIWFGSSFVKGFAITLTIGVLVSMFTAITVTRTFVRFIVPWFPEFANRLFLGFKKHDK